MTFGTFAAGRAGAPAAAAPPRETLSGNFLKITGDGFRRGELQGLRLRDGALRLRAAGEGSWTSPIYYTQDFNDLVVSWNSDTPEGTWVELSARAWLPARQHWTCWLSWGRWSTRIARASVRGEDEYCWANSVPGYGDSTLNLKDDLVAGAFQLRAVLHADAEAACPSLRLAAASFKNTADPDWPQTCALSEPEVPEMKSVLLDTPAFSQRCRAPEYAGVICSATCIAMQLCGRGEDVLPEDIALLAYDHGYGGNGNWSFSTAAAGAFGYESYVHYMSFKGLRQELTRGCAVALSVKYGREKEGKYPYWENALTDTGGHLILAVGYRFDEARGEYVYLINDPFTPSDAETAHREFPESQLRAAWYRRAAYLVHDKTGSGAAAQTRVFAVLRPVAGRPDCWAVVWDGRFLPVPADFCAEPRRTPEHGTIFCTLEGDWRPLPEGVRRMTGNLAGRYEGLSVTPEGWLRFENDIPARAAREGKTFTVHVIGNTGRAVMALAEPYAKPYQPGEAPKPSRAGRLWRWVLPVGLAAAATVAFFHGRHKK